MSKDSIEKAKGKYLLDPKNNKDPEGRKGKKTQYAKPKGLMEGASKSAGDARVKKNRKKAMDQLMDEVKTGKKITKKKPSRYADYDTSRAVWKRNP